MDSGGSAVTGAVEDGVLVRRFLAGDADAFTSLYYKYVNVVRARVAGLLGGHASDVEDVVQEAFIKASTRVGSLREPESFAAWLLRIAHNTAVSYGTRADVARVSVLPEGQGFEELADPDPLADGENTVVAQALVEEARAAMAGMSDQLRHVTELVYFEGLDNGELSERMGVDGRQAARLRYEATAAFRSAITAFGIASFGLPRCHELRAIVQGRLPGGEEDRLFTPLMRKRVVRHLAACPTCAETAQQHGDRWRVFILLVLLAASDGSDPLFQRHPPPSVAPPPPFAPPAPLTTMPPTPTLLPAPAMAGGPGVRRGVGAALIKRLVVLALIGGAIAGGLVVLRTPSGNSPATSVNGAPTTAALQAALLTSEDVGSSYTPIPVASATSSAGANADVSDCAAFNDLNNQEAEKVYGPHPSRWAANAFFTEDSSSLTPWISESLESGDPTDVQAFSSETASSLERCGTVAFFVATPRGSSLSYTASSTDFGPGTVVMLTSVSSGSQDVDYMAYTTISPHVILQYGYVESNGDGDWQQAAVLYQQAIDKAKRMLPAA